MRICKWISMLLCLLLFSGISMNVCAEDTDPVGSLKVSILETGTGKGIANAQVDIYLVASVERNSYVFTPDFTRSHFDLSSIGNMTASENKAKASELAAYASEYKVQKTAAMLTDKSGVSNFLGLVQGLYLVCESASPKGHTLVSPFLITIPQFLNGEAVYDVDAAPKTGTADIIPTPKPTPTPNPGGRLPQTGQLWWPVLVLMTLGICLCARGAVLRGRKDYA